MRKFFFLSALALCVLTLRAIDGQSGAPVIVQAVTPVSAGIAPPKAVAVSVSDSKDAMLLLRQMQADNAAMLKKQEAALLTLDALEKAADEIKIYTKRG